MKKPSVFIVVLCGPERSGWIHPALAMALVQFTADHRFDIEVVKAFDFKESQTARNWACTEFLKTDHDFIMMLDNDGVPVVDHAIVNLLDLPAFGVDIVNAPQPTYTGDSLHLNVYQRQESGQYRPHLGEPDARGLVEADAVGTGIICIRREVIERMMGNNRNNPVFLRPRQLDGATIIGEDLLFCERAARYHRFKVYASMAHLCGHAHSVDLLNLPGLKGVQSLQTPPAPKWTPADYGLTPEECPPITEWSITPGMAKWLRNEINHVHQNQIVVELGSGVSTEVIRSCRSWNCVSIEADPEIAHELGTYCCHLKNGWYVIPWEHQIPVGLLFIDGPPGNTGPLARYPALPFFKHHLMPNALIVLDDAHRPDEQEIMRRWGQEFNLTWEVLEFEQGRKMGVARWPG